MIERNSVVTPMTLEKRKRLDRVISYMEAYPNMVMKDYFKEEFFLDDLNHLLPMKMDEFFHIAHDGQGIIVGGRTSASPYPYQQWVHLDGHVGWIHLQPTAYPVHVPITTQWRWAIIDWYRGIKKKVLG